MEKELVFHSIEAAQNVIKILLEEGYVCMLSMEENLYIVNFIWADNADRNEVVFMEREIYEEEFTKAREEWEQEREHNNKEKQITFDPLMFSDDGVKQSYENYIKELSKRTRWE